MNLGTAQVIRGNARHLPLADNSVDLVVTSPPYFALRSYQDGGEHYAGQIGDEATPAEFIDALLDVMRECMRVVKPSGSIFFNLGDKYVADNRGSGVDRKRGDAKHAPAGPLGFPTGGMRQKSLMCLPERFRIRCIDELGLIVRAVVIWSKPNGLPESVTDRVRRSHEDWMHFTLSPRYFSAVDEIREQYDAPFQPFRTKGKAMNGGAASGAHSDNTGDGLNPLGKLPGSVWTIPTEPLRVPEALGIDHFAAFPTEWPKRIIAGWSPAGVCVECGEGRRPVVTRHHERPVGDWNPDRNVENRPVTLARPSSEVTVDGYACACPEPTADTTPAVVLDPFGGTGTTALVAKALGRHGITVDMSADYCRLATWRTQDRDQLAKVLGIEKAPPIADDEQSLLDLIEGGAA